MRDWRLLLIGFGTVGQGFAARLHESADELERLGVRSRIVGVVDPVHGSFACPSGVAPDRLLEQLRIEGALTPPDDATPIAEGLEAIRTVDADVVFEMTPTDLRDGGVGLRHVRAALEAGRHVATTNKGPVALAWNELQALAASHRVQLRCEGTVMSGTPVLNLHDAGLRGAGLRAVRGVLNGTCNFILGRIEAGDDYESALRTAQELGYAETDPSGDVEGADAAAKVAILANLLLGAGASLSDVDCTGITGLDAAAVRSAPERGRRWKLVGEAAPDGERLRLVVEPRELAASDPLARVDGPGNVVVFETAALGEVAVYGPGAGRDATGHALVADLVAIHRATAAREPA